MIEKKIEKDGGIDMRTRGTAKLCIAFCLIFALVMIPGNRLMVQAEEVTVGGTVMSGTTSELLLLSTKEGKMEIKIDSGTDTSGCKVLLPDKKVNVTVSHGSDGYLHAVKIASGVQKTAASVDSSSTSTISGTLSDKSQEDILYINTAQGEMQIKLDPNTNMSGCVVLVVGNKYTVSCARGSDAYMHAVSIYDGIVSGGGSASSSLTPAPKSIVTTATTAVSGTVSDKTKESLLYLSTKEGEMEIVIDENTDSRSGMILTAGRTVTVYVYHGSDAYMHAATIVASKESVQAAGVDTTSLTTVKGTVGSKSNENKLYLDTQQGQMELKLDNVRSVVGLKVLIEGRKVSVTCARGSDAYMHAVDITG